MEDFDKSYNKIGAEMSSLESIFLYNVKKLEDIYVRC